MEEDKSKEEAQIKDLLNKLKILKNGVIEERKKSQGYLARMKEYEKVLQEKDNEIEVITKEKFQLDKELKAEKAKKSKKTFSFNSVMDKIFHKEKFSKDKLNKIQEENDKLRSANKEMEIKIKDEESLYEQEKFKFQAQLTLKANQLKELQSELAQIEKEKKEIAQREENMRDKKLEYDSNKSKYEEKLFTERTKLTESNNELKITASLKEEINEQIVKAEKDYNGLKKQLDDVTDQLREINNLSQPSNVTKREFKAKKIAKFSEVIITIIFEKVPKTNQYFIRVGDELNIKFTSITSFAPNDKSPNRFDITYMGEDGTDKKFSFLIHERLKESVTQWFNDFLSEAFSNA